MILACERIKFELYFKGIVKHSVGFIFPMMFINCPNEPNTISEF